MQSFTTWLLFSYHAPTDTSTLRVRAWRILRRIGAVSLQQSTYIVPNTLLSNRKLQQLRRLIEEAGGKVTWLEVERFSTETLEELVQLFNQACATEYNEFIATCAAIRDNPPAVDARGVELQRLAKWLRKMRARDYFGCSNWEDAQRALLQLEREFTD